jgi:hypothetical protein
VNQAGESYAAILNARLLRSRIDVGHVLQMRATAEPRMAAPPSQCFEILPVR